MTTAFAFTAAGLFVVTALYLAARSSAFSKHGWVFPALLSAAFLSFSLTAVFAEGPTGFWPEHVRNLWGNQIWFDLLLAIGIGWYLMLPKAKSLGMRPIPWLLLILCTGCIGFLAMLSRVLYLSEKTQHATGA